MSVCSICKHKIVRNACCIQCSVCRSYCHISCMPGVNKNDTIYTKRNENKWICIYCNEGLFPFNHFTEDVDFSKCISENCNSCDKISISDLQNRLFNPFEFNNNLDYLCDTDPDDKYFNVLSSNICNSDYYLEDSFKAKCSQNKYDSSCFSLIHLNIRSVPKHLDEFINYSRNLNVEFSVIGLSETWVKDSNVDLYNINGYRGEHVYRSGKCGGGVSLYVREHIDYIQRSDLIKFNEFIESVFVEIDKKHVNLPRNVIIGTIYRPPNTNIQEFINHLSEILSVLQKENKLVYLMGDYNVNLLNVDKHIPSSDFLETLYSYSYLPLINKPTRINKNTATLIDNIFCNGIENSDYLCGILYTDISDHFAVFYICSKSYINKQDQYTNKRLFSSENVEKFKSKLQQIDWNVVISSDNCQEAFSFFHNNFITLYEECFPVTRISINYRNKKLWLSKRLKRCIKIKNQLYVKSLKIPTLDNIHEYKVYRNKLHSLMRKLEREHYDEILTKNKYNLSKQWSLIKEVINKKRSNISDKFAINNVISEDKKVISESFNKFYVNIGSNLAKMIPPDNRSPTSYILDNNPYSIFLNPVSSVEVQNIIYNLKNVSPGWDELTARIIKQTCFIYLESLTHILNLSLSQGLFPNELKIAKVVPVYKSGDKMLLNNYRPVSILPVFSKLFKKIMYKRLIAFINKHNLLY